jgi:hypothetical protein
MIWKFSRFALMANCLFLVAYPGLSFSQSIFTQQEIEFADQWLPIALESDLAPNRTPAN